MKKLIMKKLFFNTNNEGTIITLLEASDGTCETFCRLGYRIIVEADSYVLYRVSMFDYRAYEMIDSFETLQEAKDYAEYEEDNLV